MDTQESLEQPPKPAPSKAMLYWLKWCGYVILIILLGVWVGFWVRKTLIVTKPKVSVTPTEPPAQPTIATRPVSAIASQSAFLKTEDSIASLSASITQLNLTNTDLNPPVVELPLGFPDN